MTWLVPEAQRRPTPNLWRAGDPRVLPIEGIVDHYTAGGFRGSVAWLCDPRAQASAHFVVSKAGDVVQLASLNDRTWHAGESTFLGRGNVNGRTWGIEIENLGPLKASTTSAFVAPDGVAWDPYPEAQMVAVLDLTRKLVALAPNAQQMRERPTLYLVGHEHVAPGRKRDPGPAFPWGRVHEAARESGGTDGK